MEGRICVVYELCTIYCTVPNNCNGTNHQLLVGVYLFVFK